MAYQRKTWQSGDYITTAALNNIEGGIASVATAVTEIQDDIETMDQEMPRIRVENHVLIVE